MLYEPKKKLLYINHYVSTRHMENFLKQSKFIQNVVQIFPYHYSTESFSYAAILLKFLNYNTK